MKQIFRNNNGEPNGLMARFAVEKKKGVFAIGLIGVMIFMWVKVLSGKGPDGAEGALASGVVNQKVQEAAQLKITYKQLPVIPGRNDVLSRDFFGGGFEGFGMKGERSGVNREKRVVSNNGVERNIRELKKKLKLQAICSGSNPQAYVNDKLLAVGDKFIIGDESGKYECEVVGIEENEVKVKYLEAEITLKLEHVSGQGF